MNLTGSQIDKLQQALLSAFPTKSQLEQLVRIHLDANLEAVVAGDNLTDKVYYLILWVESTGQVAQLIEGANKRNPGNAELQKFLEDFDSSKTQSISFANPTETYAKWLKNNRSNVQGLSSLLRQHDINANEQSAVLTVGKYNVFHTTGQYNSKGLLVIIDGPSNEVVLLDTDFKLGIKKIKVFKNKNGSPAYVLIVKYITMTGTGTYGESTKFFTAHKNMVQLSLDKPYYEINSGWNAFETDTVRFKLRNDFIYRNNILELHARGVVEIGHSTPEYRRLPEEIYVWDAHTRQFEQVVGRLTYKQGLMTGIYSDLADPKGEWFKMPTILEGRDYHNFVDEKW